MRIALIRHGETIWNVIGRVMGQLDSSLTDKGILGAKRLGEMLKEINFSTIYSSDLGRARQTSEIINEATNISITFDYRLRERNNGIFEGMFFKDINVKYPLEAEEYRNNKYLYQVPNGESYEEHSARILSFLNDLKACHAEENILVITHGWTIAIMIELLLGLPPGKAESYPRHNTAYNSLICESGKWEMEHWGDLSPLAGCHP